MAIPQRSVRPEPALLDDVRTHDPAKAGAKLWLLRGGFVFALILVIGAQIYVHRQKSLWSSDPLTQAQTGIAGAAGSQSEAGDRTDGKPGAAIATYSPSGPVSANLLSLNWDAVPAASHYLLRINTVSGGVVVDRLVVEESSWSPPFEILPALQPGEYSWQVEAIGADGSTVERSLPAQIRITR